MNEHSRKLVYFLALSLIFTGCSSTTPEAEVVEQEVTVEIPLKEEVETTEDNNVDEVTVQVDVDIVDAEVVNEKATTEETAKEKPKQTLEVEKTEAEEPVEEKIESVETEMAVKEEPTAEESVVEEASDTEVVIETPTTKEAEAEKSSAEEVVNETPVAEEATIEEPAVDEPTAEEPTGLTGTFSTTGNSYDDYGWKPSLSLTFENGTITNVNYDEINADGAKKSKDTGYLSYFNQQTGVKLDEVYKTLSKDLLAVQTPESVDSVSGATIASENFVKLAKKIIADNQ